MQVSDDIFLGPVYNPGRAASGGPSPMELGVGPMGRIYVWDVVAEAKSTTAVAAVQDLSATTTVAINGAKASGGVATFATPRGVDILASDVGDTTQTVTIVGTDVYGQAMSETITFNGTSRVSGKKAFKTITSATLSAFLTANGSIGSTDVLGIPVRVTDAAYIVRAGYNNTLAEDAGTFAAAVTSTATATTGDVRGTYIPSSAPDAAKRLVMAIALPALAVGPDATYTGAYGVTQA